MIMENKVKSSFEINFPVASCDVEVFVYSYDNEIDKPLVNKVFHTGFYPFIDPDLNEFIRSSSILFPSGKIRIVIHNIPVENG